MQSFVEGAVQSCWASSSDEYPLIVSENSFLCGERSSLADILPCEDLSYICTFKGYSSPSLCRKLEFNPSRAEQLQMLQYCASCAFPTTKDSACSAFSLGPQAAEQDLLSKKVAVLQRQHKTPCTPG